MLFALNLLKGKRRLLCDGVKQDIILLLFLVIRTVDRQKSLELKL